MSSSSLTVQIFIAVVAHVINMSILFVSTFSFLTGHSSDFETWTIITIGRMNLSIMLLNSNVDSWHLPSWVVNDIIKQEWNWPRSFKNGKPLEGWFFKNKLKTRLLFKNCQSLERSFHGPTRAWFWLQMYSPPSSLKHLTQLLKKCWKESTSLISFAVHLFQWSILLFKAYSII